MLANIHVGVGERSYLIHVASNNLQCLTSLLPDLKQSILVVSNPTVSELYSQLRESLSGHRVVLFNMEDGEQYKTKSLNLLRID